MSKRTICVIPARLEARRFPQKLLSVLGGKPLLQSVWEAARSVACFDRVLFAVDSVELGKVIDAFGGS